MCVKSAWLCAYMFMKVCVFVTCFCLMSMCDLQVSMRPNLRVRLKIQNLRSVLKQIKNAHFNNLVAISLDLLVK